MSDIQKLNKPICTNVTSAQNKPDWVEKYNWTNQYDAARVLSLNTEEMRQLLTTVKKKTTSIEAPAAVFFNTLYDPSSVVNDGNQKLDGLSEVI